MPMWSRTQVHSHIVLVAKHARLCDIAPWATGIAHIVGLFQPDMREAVVDAASRRYFYKTLFLPAAALGTDAVGAHGDSAVDGIFDLYSQSAGVTMQILGLSLEVVETVGVLDVERCDASHFSLLFFGKIDKLRRAATLNIHDYAIKTRCGNKSGFDFFYFYPL